MAALTLISLGGWLGAVGAAKLPVQNAARVGCVGQLVENGVQRFKVTGQQAGIGTHEGLRFVNLGVADLTPQVQGSVNIIDEGRIVVTDGAGQVVRGRVGGD